MATMTGFDVTMTTELATEVCSSEAIQKAKWAARQTAAAPERTDAVLAALAAEGIPATVIGRVTEASAGLRLRTSNGVRELPGFPRDELARYMAQAS